MFEDAVARLRQWAPQRALGARVHPADAPIAVGTTLLVALAFGPFEVVVPNRVVVVVDEPGRFGFAYGTLDGHPERGEESFVVEHGADGVVRFTVAVDAEPATVPARLVAPAVRYVQMFALRTYVRSLA